MDWLIVIAALLVVVAVAVLVMTRGRSAGLKRRFGPEYDHVVEETGDRRSAEARLRERAKQHDALDLRDLEPDAAARYVERWREIQVQFVDDPQGTVDAADALVENVIGERGYPVGEFEERVELVSVDHPQVIESYRVAHAVHYGRQDRATIDDLRQAFQHYRSVFNELLGDATRGVREP